MSGQKCAGEVSYGGSWGRYRACKHAGTLEHAGKVWCKLHHPPTMEAKRKERNDKWSAKFAADIAAAKSAANERKELARRADCFPELLAAQTMGQTLNTPDFIDWMADRLVMVHGDSENMDFIHSARDRAKAGRAAITKAENKETR